MEIKFITNDRFRKLDAIFSMFGDGSLPQPVKEFPAFFGKGIYLSSMIFEASVSISKKQSIWDACFEENPEKELEKPEYKEIASMLDNLDVHLERENSDFFNELKTVINGVFSQKIEQIKTDFLRIFKMELPKTLVIILDKHSVKNGSHGQKLAANKEVSVIGYRIGELALKRDSNEPVSVILHELLHCLFSSYNVFERKYEGELEEAILRYFAPYGILTERLGLQKPDVRGTYIEQLKGACSQELANKLNKILPRYSEAIDKMNFWEFISKSDLKESINKNVLL